MKLLLFGVGVWATPFAAGVMLFPLKDGLPGLFDSLVSVALCAGAVLLGVRYASGQSDFSTGAGLKVGAIWCGVCLAIDLPMFLFGFGMSIEAYFTDIAFAYLMVPVVVAGLGKAAPRRVLVEGAAGADVVGRRLDQTLHHPVAGQPEDIVDVVVFAPFDYLI